MNQPVYGMNPGMGSPMGMGGPYGASPLGMGSPMGMGGPYGASPMGMGSPMGMQPQTSPMGVPYGGVSQPLGTYTPPMNATMSPYGSPAVSPYASNPGMVNPMGTNPMVTQAAVNNTIQQQAAVSNAIVNNAVAQNSVAQQMAVNMMGRIYVLKEGLCTYKDDYWVIDMDQACKLFKISQRFIDLTLGRTFVFEDPMGNMMMRIQEKPMHLTKTIDVETLSGDIIARVHKEVTFSAPCFSMKFHSNHFGMYNTSDRWKVTGDFAGYNFNVHHKDGKHIAQLARSLLDGNKYAGSYGLRVVGRHNDCLLIALAICVELMMHT